MRTNRPLPLTVMLLTTQTPAVVLKIVVQLLPSFEVWIWNARANAASQRRVTRPTWVGLPRSTRSHCGSVNALDPRVDWLPSLPWNARKSLVSFDDDSAGLL